MASTNINMLKITGNNKQSDECYTPNEAILPLIQFLKKDLIYYDCTSGNSLNIVNFLNSNGFNCKSSENRDFLKDDTPNDIDVIITNPPYSIKDKFIKKCYDLNKPFALLLPITTLQGQRRSKWFAEFGIELLVLSKRIDFTGKGSPHFGVGWFCHNILPKPLIFS